jgi:hypothetical protein
MRLRNIIGPAIALGVCVFVLVSYVTYTDYRDTMRANGAWTAHLEGYVEWSGLGAKAHVTDLSTDYDRTPDIPSAEDWISAWFDSDSKIPGGNLSAAELFKVRILLIADPANAPTRNLIDKTYTVRYGDIENNQALSFNYTVGPYVSHNASYPIKLSLKIIINGEQDYAETHTLRAPTVREGF